MIRQEPREAVRRPRPRARALESRRFETAQAVPSAVRPVPALRRREEPATNLAPADVAWAWGAGVESRRTSSRSRPQPASASGIRRSRTPARRRAQKIPAKQRVEETALTDVQAEGVAEKALTDVWPTLPVHGGEEAASEKQLDRPQKPTLRANGYARFRLDSSASPKEQESGQGTLGFRGGPHWDLCLLQHLRFATESWPATSHGQHSKSPSVLPTSRHPMITRSALPDSGDNYRRRAPDTRNEL